MSYLNLPAGGGVARTPDSAGVSPTSDIDLRVRAAPTAWASGSTQTFMSCRTGNIGGANAWSWRLESSGMMQLIWWNSSGTLVAPGGVSSPGYAAGSAQWLRVTLDADDGAGGSLLSYYSSSDGISWTLQTSYAGAVTSILNSTEYVTVGAYNDKPDEPLVGRIYYAELRLTIGGTIAASPDFSAQAAGVTSFSDAQGNVWTLAGVASIVADASSLLLLRRRRSA